jgi:hypothetical protein
MLGPTKKPIPGPDGERHALIRKIIRYRLGNDDPICAELDALPVPMLKLTAEAAILFIVEQFLTIFIADATEQLAVKTLNAMHSDALSVGGQVLPVLDRPTTLSQYVQHYLDTQFSGTGPYTEPFVAESIRMVKSYYGREPLQTKPQQRKSFLERIFGKPEPEKASTAHTATREALISGYRRVAAQRGCAPGPRFPDDKIIEIYTRVCTEFTAAAKVRNERIPASILNHIALHFMVMSEGLGDAVYEWQFPYEVEKYLNEGLRDDFRQALPLF